VLKARKGDRRAQPQHPAPDVKVRPYYDRSDLVRCHHRHGGRQSSPRDGAGLLVLLFFLVSFRAAVITALTIPLALLFAFIFLHASGGAANLLSIGAIDSGSSLTAPL